MKHKKLAFTLVELIVVITIIAILGTIAFISLQGYSKSSRDSVRISDMSKIKTTLELFHINAGKYPKTTGGYNVTYSGGTVWSQGVFGDVTFNSVDKMDDIPLDPLTEKKYTYSLLNTKQEYEIAGIMEGDDYSMFSEAYAVTKTANVMVTGNYNGMLAKVSTGSVTYVLAVPTIVNSDENTLDLVDIINARKLVYNGYKNLPSHYSGSAFDVYGETDLNLVNSTAIVVYEGDLSGLKDESNQVILIENLQLAYTGTKLSNISDIENILALDTVNDIEATKFFSQVLVNNTIDSTIEITSSPSSSGGGGGISGAPATCLDMTDEHLSTLNTFMNQGSISGRDSGWTEYTGSSFTKSEWCNFVELDVYNSAITTLPEEITYLKDLLWIYIWDTPLTSLPEGIGNLTNLNTLDIYGGSLTSIPDELFNLTNLTGLAFSDNLSLGNIGYSFDTSSDVKCQDNITDAGGTMCIGGNGTNVSITDGSEYVTCIDNISDTGLTNLNTAFSKTYTKFNWCTLSTLDGSSSSLTSIPTEIGNLINLTNLRLDYNSLTSIPAEIGNLINLDILYLNNNLLTSLPPEIGNLTNLETLLLSSNSGLGVLSKTYNYFSVSTVCQDNITINGGLCIGMSGSYVYFTDTHPTLTIIDNITDQSLVNLNTDLNSSYTKAEWGNMTNLTKISAGITSIPIEIELLTNLTSINLSVNSIASIPVEIGNLTNLTYLYLSDNSITNIPVEIGNLTNLIALTLGTNLITSIPIEIGNLTNLRDLFIGHNSLTSLPPEIGNLVNLEILRIDYNSLTSLPPEIGNLVILEELYGGYNSIISIPVEIGNLINITYLNISNNSLTSLPAEIGNLINLRSLILDYNSLTSLPSEIGNLVSLITFNLYYNGLTSLPSEIGDLVNLKYLYLNYNSLLNNLSSSFSYSNTVELCQLDIPTTGQTMCIVGNGTTIDITVTP